MSESVDRFIGALEARKYGPFFGVPCSLLGSLITKLAAGQEGRYLPVNNEGEGVAIAAGACLANRKPVVLMQNSGLGNAVNPIASLVVPNGLPLLFVVSWRGRPGVRDEPQHQLMGRITPTVLSLLTIEHEVIGGPGFDFDAALDRADARKRHGSSYALIATAEAFR